MNLLRTPKENLEVIIDGVPLDAPLPKQEQEGPPPKPGLLPTPTSGPPAALLPTPTDPEKKVSCLQR